MPQPFKQELPPLKIDLSLIGKQIQTFRKEKAFTQSQLANKIGITQELVSSYERGRLNISVEMLIRFSEALDISPNKLLNFKEEILNKKEKTISLRLMKRLTEISLLPEAKQKFILKTIDELIKAAKQE